jgi:hypothetical protein
MRGRCSWRACGASQRLGRSESAYVRETSNVINNGRMARTLPKGEYCAARRSEAS